MKTLTDLHTEMCSSGGCPGTQCQFQQAIDRASAIRDEALKEWKVWAEEGSVELEYDEGPDGRKYRRIKAEIL